MIYFHLNEYIKYDNFDVLSIQKSITANALHSLPCTMPDVCRELYTHSPSLPYGSVIFQGLNSHTWLP